MIVKTYYINSLEHLDNITPEMITLCDFHNARGCINLNKRSFEKLAYQTLRKITEQILNKDFKNVKDAYNSVCGAYSNESEKKWIVDIDEKDLNLVNLVSDDIKNIEPNIGLTKVKEIIETKNGYHLITSPFNMMEFKKLYPTIDVHKDNPTVLYMK